MAALKMDELLVTWLNSEGVYESIMSFIEQEIRNDSSSSATASVLNSTGANVISSSGSGKAASSGRPVGGSSNSSVNYLPPLSPYKVNSSNNALIGSNTIINSSTDSSNKKIITHVMIPRNMGGRGRGKPSQEDVYELREKEIVHAFSSVRGSASMSAGQIYLRVEEFEHVTKDLCGFPTFFTVPLYKRICQQFGGGEAIVTLDIFTRFWKSEIEPFDPSDRFFRLVKSPGEDSIKKDDFGPFIDELLNSHPGLEFLSNHAEFQEKYKLTVITRIFYQCSTGHNGRITGRQCRKMNLLDSFLFVGQEEDINKVTQYFSYEHFYVLYCRFWELDQDRDYRITRDDLMRYNDQSLSRIIVDRIFDAAPRPFGRNEPLTTLSDNQKANDTSPVGYDDYLSYEDFIYFMLSEEDKSNEVSARYWFSCLTHGDSKLSFMEMRKFYSRQLHRMQSLGHEVVPFEDMLCQVSLTSYSLYPPNSFLNLDDTDYFVYCLDA